MYFQISPVVRQKTKTVVQKKGENDENIIEILSLAPFTPNPKVAFDNVPVGSVQTRKLLIRNPTHQDVNLIISNNIPDELGLELSWTEKCIEKNNEHILEMVWAPLSEEASRHNLILSNGRMTRNVPITFKSMVLKKSKAKSKTRAPITVPLTRKPISPVKKFKPLKQPSAFGLTQVSPINNREHKYDMNNKETSSLSTKMDEQETTTYTSFRRDQEVRQQRQCPYTKPNNKENTPPPSQPYFLSSTATSFLSPTNVNISMDNNDDVFGRRGAFVLSPLNERRETYILKTDKIQPFFERNKLELTPVESKTFKIHTPETSPMFRDSLEPPTQRLCSEESNACTNNSLNVPSNFEYNLKMLDSFNFSPADSRFINKSIRFSPNINLSSTPNSFETYTKSVEHIAASNSTFDVNVSGNTFTKQNNSLNVSGGTYVKDISTEDNLLEKSPISSKSSQDKSSAVLKLRSFDISGVTESNVNILEARRVYNLSSIAEESCVFSESSLRVGTKRKSPIMFDDLTTKRGRISTDWVKKGGAAFRVAKSSTGLNLKQFAQATRSESKLERISTITETSVRTVIVRNPFLYGDIVDPFQATSVYQTDEWMDEQQTRFKKWLNVLLTPPEELSSKTEVDAAKIWQECKKKEVAKAPTRETVASNYHVSNKLVNLRKQAQAFFRSKEISDVLLKVCNVVNAGKLSIRDDRDLHLNLKLKSDIMELILGYNPLWLRIGLETIYNEVIPLKSNSDASGLAHFVLERFFKDPYLLKKHKTVYSPKYMADLKKFMLIKFLTLVYFLDKAKDSKLIQHDPCLFCKNSTNKESKLVLTAFARETLSAVGDITKYLKSLGYVVVYKQTYLDEFDYSVNNLGVDLRDGVRLTKTMEILQMRSDLSKKLRVPAISRLQKVHNMQVVFTSLQESGYNIQYDITPKDIVDGHKENTLSLLWQIIYKFEAPLMVKSATTIQTWFRSLPVILKRRKLQKEHEHRQNAARKIQAFYRRYRLSKMYSALADIVSDFVEERKQRMAALRRIGNASATLIQKHFRMYIARKRFIQLKKAVTIMQRRFRANQQAIRDEQRFKNLKSSTLIIQRRFRGYLESQRCRSQYMKTRNTVIALQSFGRTYLVRKRVVRVRQAVILIQRWYRATRAMIRQRDTYRELKISCIVIQQRYRSILETRTVRASFLEQRKAVIKIQHWYRATIDMKNCRRRFQALKSATKIIQEQYRANKNMERARQHYLILKKYTVIVQKTFRANIQMRIDRDRFLEQRDAVMKIQCWYKAKCAMRTCRNHYQALRKAAVVIQRRYRAEKAMEAQREQYLQLRNAVIIIQRKFRAKVQMRIYRNRFLEQRDAAVKIQCWYRAKCAMRTCRNHYEGLKKASLFIQRRYRAQKVMQVHREQYIQLRKAVISIQRRFRANLQMRIDRDSFLLQRTSVLKIQCWYRAKCSMRTCRNHYEALKNAVVLIQRLYRAGKLMQAQREQHLRLRNATIAIQRRFRARVQMKIASNKFQMEKRAVIMIQSWFRGIKQTRECRSRFMSLKLATNVIQERYKANILMRKERLYFQTMKKIVIMIQQKFRAKLVMRICKNDYVALRCAVLVVQRRYRAQKAMQVHVQQFQTLKNNVIAIQRRYRANVQTRIDAHKFQKQRRAAIIIQRWYRGITEMKKYRSRFMSIKLATNVIQERYKAKILMRKERLYFQTLKKITIIIQQRFRAKIAMRTCKNNYYALRNAALIIQRRYRAQKAVQIQREQYIRLRNAAIVIQRRFKLNRVGKIERNHYICMIHSAVVIQQHFRAHIEMKIVRRQYVILKQTTITIQRRFRAIQLMKHDKREYESTKKAALTIQRCFRAQKAMKEQKTYYEKLRSAVITIQMRYRANRLRYAQRKEYVALRRAAIFLQRRFRANKMMVGQREVYCRIKWAAIVLQRRYRARQAMRQEMAKYLKLKHATFVLQRKWRAELLSRKMRKQFLSFRRSVMVIQMHIRAYLHMRQERLVFLAKYSAVINIQRISRGYLIRKLCTPMLQPEAVEARRVLKKQSGAAVKIQSTWRGYSVRKSNNSIMTALNKHRQKTQTCPQLQSNQGKTLSQRCDMALLCMTNRNSTLFMIMKALEDLEFITRHCRNTCIRLSELLPDQLYIMLSSAARSWPEMIASNVAAFILINFYKYSETRPRSWAPEYLNSVINILVHWCDKEAPLFSTLCTLLWLFAHEEPWKKVIRNVPNLKHRFVKIGQLVSRKQGMCSRSKHSTKVAAVFGSTGQLTLPTRNANWGLDYDRPHTFTNAVFAYNSLVDILGLIDKD